MDKFRIWHAVILFLALYGFVSLLGMVEREEITYDDVDEAKQEAYKEGYEKGYIDCGDDVLDKYGIYVETDDWRSSWQRR